MNETNVTNKAGRPPEISNPVKVTTIISGELLEWLNKWHGAGKKSEVLRDALEMFRRMSCLDGEE